MTIILFLIILGVLVFVHELGHFLLAKRAGVAVEEFGFGYPPRAKILGKKWGTLFTLNWVPFGGFVKIVGEDYDKEDAVAGNNSLRSQDASHISLREHSLLPLQASGKNFTQISKKWQAAILAAGVAFNMLFAWLLFSLSFAVGLPAPAENQYGVEVKDPALTITDVLPDSPAQKAGIKSGDKIISISTQNGSFRSLTPEKAAEAINSSSGEVSVGVLRGSKELSFAAVPMAGIVEDKRIIGIDMEIVGTLRLPIHRAALEGGKTTLEISYSTVMGIGGLLRDAFRGHADISGIAGPVGIVGLVGDASSLGFIYLVTFTALISINLAVINLVPFPALDGGRILFVAIEAVIKKPINAKVAYAVNTVGFSLIILLMLFITYRDILKLL